MQEKKGRRKAGIFIPGEGKVGFGSLFSLQQADFSSDGQLGLAGSTAL